MCLLCPINAEQYDFRLSGNKWGNIQTLGFSRDNVSYRFAEQNFPGQFSNFDAFITEELFQLEITVSFAAWQEVAGIRFILEAD